MFYPDISCFMYNYTHSPLLPVGALTLGRRVQYETEGLSGNQVIRACDACQKSNEKIESKNLKKKNIDMDVAQFLSHCILTTNIQ